MERTRWLIVLVFALAFGLAAGVTNADLIAYEPFNYTAGSLHDASGGTGWVDNWDKNAGSPGGFIAGTGSLVHPDFAGRIATEGNHGIIVGGLVDDYWDRTIMGTIAQQNGEEVWFSCLFQSVNGEGQTWISLLGWGSTWCTEGSEMLLYSHPLDGGYPFFDPWDPFPEPAAVHWIVFKWKKTVGGWVQARCHGWLDPDPGVKPTIDDPTYAGVQKIRTAPGQGWWFSNFIGFDDAYGESGDFFKIDEIRYGNEFRDVTGYDPKLASTPRPLAGEENVDPNLPELVWNGPEESFCTPKYDVWFGTDPTMAGSTKIGNNQAPNSVSISPMPFDTPHYWRVDVIDCNSYEITAIANIASGQVRAAADHGGYIVPALDVTITDTTNYNGTHTVTNVPDNTHFDFVHTWDGTETGNVEVPVTRTGRAWPFTTWSYSPVIWQHPEDVFVPASENATFTVDSGGHEAATHNYQWYYYPSPGDSNSLLAGETSDTLTINNVQPGPRAGGDEGFYWCKVSNNHDDPNSDAAALVVTRLTAWYKFNGDVLDSELEGDEYDGTAVGTPGYVAGKDGQAIDLDGVDDYVDVDYPAIGVLDSYEKLTVTAWVNPNPDPAGRGVILASHGWEPGGIFIDRDPDLPVGVYIIGNNPSVISATGYAFPEGEWTFVAFVYDTGEGVGSGKLYFNGEKEAEVEYTEYKSAKPIPIGPFSMGAWMSAVPAPGVFFDGKLDDVRIYTYALSPLHIASLYNEMTGESICIEYHELDFDGDCDVDGLDLKEMADTWLERCKFVPLCEP